MGTEHKFYKRIINVFKYLHLYLERKRSSKKKHFLLGLLIFYLVFPLQCSNSFLVISNICFLQMVCFLCYPAFHFSTRLEEHLNPKKK